MRHSAVDRRWIIVLAAIVLVVAVLVIVVALASSDDEPAVAPISVTDSQVPAECISGTYVPGTTGSDLGEGKPPRDWGAVEDAQGAVQADRGAIEIVIRPREGTKRITLTGIDFEPDYRTRPAGGGAFYRPCKRQLVGPAIEADLDPEPVRRFAPGGPEYIEASSASPDTTLGPGLSLAGASKPIRFPWTVSLAKPLHLYLVVRAEDSYCTWSARLSWKSGSERGTIPIDNGGKKYRIVDTTGVLWYKPGPGGRWISRGERLVG
jgi:hypothetical protein